MARKPASTTPSEVTVRMYNVGFGDCFLLTFRYPKGDRHMLIDYGSAAAPRNMRGKYMAAVARMEYRPARGAESWKLPSASVVVVAIRALPCCKSTVAPRTTARP